MPRDWQRTEWERRLSQPTTEALYRALGQVPELAAASDISEEALDQAKLNDAERVYRQARQERQRVQDLVRDHREGAATLVTAQWKEAQARHRLDELRKRKRQRPSSPDNL